MSINFQALAADLLARADTLVPSWLPGGRRRGHEWVCGNLRGEPGDSCSVNLNTGLWADFAGDAKGADLINLYAAIHGCSQGEAARELSPESIAAVPRTNGSHPPARQPEPVSVAPEVAPRSQFEHSAYGHPTAWWAYHNAAGQITGYICRYQDGDKKQILPWRWINDRWQSKGWPAPRPLYQLHRLASAERILVVEGEKTAEAAQGLLPSYTVTTWQGGAQAVSKADITPLAGKDVLLWPDADEPGIKAMRSLGVALLAMGREPRIVLTQGMQGGWDLADAAANGWDTKQVVAWAKERTERFMAAPQADSPEIAAPAGSAPMQAMGRLSAVKRGHPRSKPDGSPPNGATQIEPDGSVFVSWESLGLKRNSRGSPEDNLSNAMLVISDHPALGGKIWADDFLQRIMTTWNGPKREWKDGDDLLLTEWFQRAMRMPKLSLKTVREAVQAIAFLNRRNELTEWLNTLQWDGIERLPTLMSDAFGTLQDDYTAAVGRCWLVSMIARAFKPGAKVDYAPVFEGIEGINKSTAMSIIGGEWFAECHEKITDKDFLQALQGVWLIEIAELNSFSKSEIRRIKSVISCQDDRYRASYGRYTERHPRQCVFCATTNEDDWNESDTGARRFWPIRCGEICIDYLRANREQLFAEAVHRYHQGEKWWDVPNEEAKNQQELRRKRDEWEGIIERYVTWEPSHYENSVRKWIARNEPLEKLTTQEILETALDIPPGKWTRSDQMRVSSALKSSSWKRIQLGSDKKWFYVKRAKPIQQDVFQDPENL